MLFHSVAFAVFLPLVWTAYWLLRGTKPQNALLLAASLVFYGWWDPRFLLLLGFSIVIDYWIMRAADRERARDARRAAEDPGSRSRVATQLGHARRLQVLRLLRRERRCRSGNALGWRPDLLHIVLPVGISFYTFHTLSYTIDVYRGQLAGAPLAARRGHVRLLLPAARRGADRARAIAARRRSSAARGSTATTCATA